MKKQLLILASPSGGGKSTFARHLLSHYPEFRLSISATTRNQRPGEQDGKDYYFMSKSEFVKAIDDNKFIEYEMIFDNYYGTLKTEVSNSIRNGEKLLFDVDVKGALSIKKLFSENALLIFIAPPSLEILEQRLRRRKTETEEQIRTRLSRAAMEMSHKDEFDFIIINNELQEALNEAETIVKNNCY